MPDLISQDEAIAQTIHGVPEPKEVTQPAAPIAEVVAPANEVIAPIAEAAQEPAPIETGAEPTATVELTVVENKTGEEQSFDQGAWLKQEFGEDNLEVLKAKLNTPAKFVPEFPNDESRIIFEALISGNTKEVKDYLDRKSLAESVASQPIEEKIKAHIRLTNPLFDEDDILAEFEDKYVPDEIEIDDDSKYIRAKKKAQQLMQIDGKAADEYFAKLTTDITFPTIEQSAPASAENTNDFETEGAKKVLSFANDLNSSISVDSNIAFELNNNDFNLKGQVLIPQEKVDAIKVQLEGRVDLFVKSRYFDKDDNFNENLFAKDVYTLTNQPTLLKAAASEALTKGKKEWLKANRNYADTGLKPSGDILMSEDDLKRKAYREFWNPSAVTKG